MTFLPLNSDLVLKNPSKLAKKRRTVLYIFTDWKMKVLKFRDSLRWPNSPEKRHILIDGLKDCKKISSLRICCNNERTEIAPYNWKNTFPAGKAAEDCDKLFSRTVLETNQRLLSSHDKTQQNFKITIPLFNFDVETMIINFGLSNESNIRRECGSTGIT